MTTMAVLEGGPDDLPERVVPVAAPGEDLKIAHRGGYEHFRATSRFRNGGQNAGEGGGEGGRLPVYEWWERTEIAE
ncbi:DUF5988 family protein [Streptomyces sp. RerS4]|uniref:DUF5988 family protein n=1 Tax=Streptomyces sp. RerS4 TaxID=2942449 RepID=UPI00201CAB20|nr:DUF5988 family protein [Streptomyces sp. RerS4]UQW99480.1 DUF5988 family protein [Streptomyces sp. RerS4]